MNKRSQLRIERRDGKIIMADTAGNEYQLTATQAENLGRQLIGEAKQLKRAWSLRRFVQRRAGVAK